MLAAVAMLAVWVNVEGRWRCATVDILVRRIICTNICCTTRGGENMKRDSFAFFICLSTTALLLLARPLSALAYDPCGSEPPTSLEMQTQVAPLALTGEPFSLIGSSSSSVVRRLWGDTRYDTMRVVATTGFTRASTVVLACGDNYPDALAAASIAGINDSPVLLTGKDALPAQTADAIKLLGANKTIILGGEAAVSSNVANSLAGMGLKVSRIQGQTREQTAALIAEDVVSQSSPDTIIIANGYVPWDSLSVSPYAYSNGFPILLTSSNGLLSDDVLKSIHAMPGIKKAIVVGGPNAVSEGVSSQLTGLQVQRWWGQTRYETSEAIASHSISSGSSPSVVGIASGENFPDALTGGALIGARKGVLLLSSFGGFEPSDYIAAVKPQVSRCYVLGGSAALSPDVEKSVSSLLECGDSGVDSSVPENQDVIVFAPHQDDEVLSMGAFIRQSVDNGCRVHVVLCTDGSRSWVRTELANGLTCSFHEGSHVYSLSEGQFVSSRDDEFFESCQALGVSPLDVLIDDGRSVDGLLDVDAAKAIISKYLAQYPNAVVCTTSPVVGLSQHSDHRALGNAALELYREGAITDLRLFVEPYNLTDFQRCNPGLGLEETASSGDASALLAACDAYSMWNPPANRYAIGYHSVGGDFDAFSGSGYVSYWHAASFL